MKQIDSRTYFRVDPDGLVTFIARIGEYRFIAFDAIWMIVSKHIPLSCQRFITLPATKMTRMPVLVHSFGVFSTEN